MSRKDVLLRRTNIKKKQNKKKNTSIIQILSNGQFWNSDLSIFHIFVCRPDFAQVLSIMSKSSAPVVSIDIPSGWNVETGPEKGSDVIQPEMLISLTAPKMCAAKFSGKHHFLGGRFVPKAMQEKYEMNLPRYPGLDTCVRL